MSRPPFNPARIEWSGDNPGIYLKTDPAGDYTALALYFRVVLSPHGQGQAAIVLGAPDVAAGWPAAPNVVMTDNQRLMRWIIDGWVRDMPTFRGRTGLDAAGWLHVEGVESGGAADLSTHRVTLSGPGLVLGLSWDALGPPLPVEVDPENSATGAHEMYSVFREAGSAAITLNGTRLPGAVAMRDFFGRRMSTAFLAFAETWLTPETETAP